jgi:DNA-directed RNA polymerase specialized sigma24 family protein
MPGSPVSATEVAGRIDWTALTPEARRTLREIALAIWFGAERYEIAAALGISREEVGRRLTVLRREIRQQLTEGGR